MHYQEVNLIWQATSMLYPCLQCNGQDLYIVPGVKEPPRLLTEPAQIRKEPQYEHVQGH